MKVVIPINPKIFELRKQAAAVKAHGRREKVHYDVVPAKHKKGHHAAAR